MATHFWGPLHLMLELVPSMRRRGFGRIVNIARSAAGSPCRTSRRTAPASSRWSGSRMRCAPSSRSYGIRVTTVSPGLMRTGSPMNAEVKGQHEAGICVVRDCGLAAGLVDLGGARGRSDPRGLPPRRSGADDHAAGQARGRRSTQLAPASSARVMTLATRLLPGPAGAARRSSEARPGERIAVGAVGRDDADATARPY